MRKCGVPNIICQSLLSVLGNKGSTGRPSQAAGLMKGPRSVASVTCSVISVCDLPWSLYNRNPLQDFCNRARPITLDVFPWKACAAFAGYSHANQAFPPLCNKLERTRLVCWRKKASINHSGDCLTPDKQKRQTFASVDFFFFLLLSQWNKHVGVELKTYLQFVWQSFFLFFKQIFKRSPFPGH